MSLPLVTRLSGPTLGDQERAFLRDHDPFGVIVFRENLTSRDSIRRFTDTIREVLGRDAPILIDQEGGKFSRLGDLSLHRPPPPAMFGKLADVCLAKATEAAKLNGYLVACDLLDVGITVDCAPVLDVPITSTPRIIAERAFSSDPAVVAILGRAFASGLLEGGAMPVMKHIPGHGCASQDSHDVLPRVINSLSELDQRDFLPFLRNVDAIPWAMVAHVVYQEIDRDRPASQSATVIAEIIRQRIGFDGVLITDDVGMGALAGTLFDRVAACLKAGNDLVLVCDSDTERLSNIAARLKPLSEATTSRLQRAWSARRSARRHLGIEETRNRLASLMSEMSA